jgi:hypothetical protein
VLPSAAESFPASVCIGLVSRVFLENKSAMQNKTVLAFLDDVYEDLEH